ncbi:uncharacterized protein [Argopecten irradians]|uniref:uncharacterized protein n=1 Tax=Argopecten irradians TaxID=31199 RepID=UPI00371BF321
MTRTLVYAACMSILIGVALATVCRTDMDCWENEVNNGQKCVHLDIQQNKKKLCNTGQFCYCASGCKSGEYVWLTIRGPESMCACNNPITNQMICIDYMNSEK